MTKTHNHKEDAAAQAHNDVLHAFAEPAALSVTFEIDGQGKLTVRKTSWNYPRDQFGPALRILRNLLESDVEEIDNSPLPAAKFEKKTTNGQVSLSSIDQVDQKPQPQRNGLSEEAQEGFGSFPDETGGL